MTPQGVQEYKIGYIELQEGQTRVQSRQTTMIYKIIYNTCIRA
jgi:hypothetical protein